ncbi:MAG: phosphoenolpyruvate synthase [Candidatus Aenigmarchaeota archaeon]|nr:phosphoenolpyruvate synthase [Candidatus Aenigmarchaeota archaeon]
MAKHIIFFKKIRKKDVPLVGGKTASLGEMLSMGLPVPNGFAVTAEAYNYFIKKNNLDRKIRHIIKSADLKNIHELKKAGSSVRSLIKGAAFPEDLALEILSAFRQLKSNYVATRSSATAEDLPNASFAGQHESFLNVSEKNILTRVRDCFTSLFTDRAISYREDKGFDHFKVYLTVAVQKQIFSKVSGVMFTIDPDSGHKNFTVINSSYGLGDYIVQGKVVPDEIWIFKEKCKIIDKKLGRKHIMEVRSLAGVKKKSVPKSLQTKFSISDKEAEELGRYAKLIEKHYQMTMDIEWAKGSDNKLYILQARPETVYAMKNKNIYQEFRLKQKSKVIAQGLAVGRKIASGPVVIIKDAKDIQKFSKGQILVTRKTDPDWEPIMKIAAGIITEEGGRTSHAAIVSRELGVPCIVGVPNATKRLKSNQLVTMDCTEETGKIWYGPLKFFVTERSIKDIPKTKTHILVNIGMPEEAAEVSLLPVDGVGLAREEFIISSFIGVHPLEMIKQKKEAVFVDKLAYGIAKILAAFYPRPVIVRLSDFKTNEYRTLKGGSAYEPSEENPMIGWRGASRYISKEFEPAFRLECKAFKKVIDEMGLTNVKMMVPFCRTIEEAEAVLKIVKEEKVKCSIGVMAEIPSNIILADQFSKIFDFFSIGSNDLTQLVLGLDRDNSMLAHEFNERNLAVKRMISQLIRTAHKNKIPVGICGQAPSDYADFTKFLVECGIDSISINPDVAVQTKMLVAKLEKAL